jgi:predicted Zn-dependent protease
MRPAIALCAAAVVSCTAGGRPARAGAGAASVLDPDERSAAVSADAQEAELHRRGLVGSDATLELYLREVVARLAPAESLDALRVRPRVVVDSRPYHLALANGATFVTTGLLARLDCEAQLAMALAHDVARVAGRHAAKQQRKARERTPGLYGRARAAALRAYAHELELAADADALARVRQAGYDLGEAVRFLERHRDLAAEYAGASPEPGATAAPAAARIAAAQQLVARWGGPRPGTRNAEVYARETAEVLVPVARDLLAGGRLAPAREVVERRVRLAPSDATAHLLLGEIARREATGPSVEVAVSAYRRALELDAALAEAWRGLGLALSRRGEHAGAREAFGRYLELAPDAPDRAHIEAALRSPP